MSTFKFFCSFPPCSSLHLARSSSILMGCHVDASDGLCLSQKLSQVYLHNDRKPELGVVPHEEALFSLAEEDSLCSQDLFCTPDFLTPVEQQFSVDFEGNKVNHSCVNSPSKSSPIRSKRPRPDAINVQHHLGWPKISVEYPASLETSASEENGATVSSAGPRTEKHRNAGLIPSNSRAKLSAIRGRVLSPPCVKNPFLFQDTEDTLFNVERLHYRAQAHLKPILGANSLSRYREDFHEIQEIGRGDFGFVYKVLKRIDGCFYAVKRTHRQLCQDSERKQALTEVQALAAIGFHENVVRYHTAWFENDYLYIQMELCDGSLRSWKHVGAGSPERFLLQVMHQVAQALAFIHSCGIAHLDVKPDNIYFVGKTFKLGDFGRATRLDGSISIEEGDVRYMPLEIINDDYCHIPKADMFALGASIYELARDLPLPSSGTQFQALRQGKLSLLPGFSLPFQNVLKNLMHPSPLARPSAQDLLKHPIFAIMG